MTRTQLNIAAHQTAQALIEKLRDESSDERTVIEAAIQQLRLLIEPVRLEPTMVSSFPRLAEKIQL